MIPGIRFAKEKLYRWLTFEYPTLPKALYTLPP
jgi:hypothetical protein